VVVPARAFGANERVRVGFVGVRNQGTNNLKALMDHAVAVCDVDKDVLAKAVALAHEKGGKKVLAFSDYRALLDRKDVDAVVVTTPDHWHALITTDACRAGKDVYCEKPLSLTVAEGRAMVEAARAHARVVQTGSQQRSDARFRLACELVRNGRLGKVKRVLVGLPGVNFKGPGVADSAPPPELDYEFWLGPAPERPYNEKRVHYNFRFFWDYSGGQMTNFGAHHLDIAQWALGRDDSGPVVAQGTAAFNKDHWYEVPESSRVTFTYDDGVTVVCEQGMKAGAGQGVTFEGTEGTLYVTRGKIESSRAEILKRPIKEGEVHLYASKNHHADWLDCVKSRKRPIADVEVGHRSATVCHLGNIAVRTGRAIRWDPSREEVLGDAEASAMLKRPYRSPWRSPVA
jgi:predicted dehydrogenase